MYTGYEWMAAEMFGGLDAILLLLCGFNGRVH